MANIEFYLKPKNEIDEIPVREGNILFDTTNKNLLVDENGTRESYGGGGGGTDIVDLTREAYDDLPDTKLTDGKMYHVTDQDVTPTSANMVTLVKDGQQTNVQSGFDDLNGQLSELGIKKVFLVNSSDYGNLNAGGVVNITFDLTSHNLKRVPIMLGFSSFWTVCRLSGATLTSATITVTNPSSNNVSSSSNPITVTLAEPL